MFISKKVLVVIGVIVILISVVGAGMAQGDEITACVKKNGQVVFLTEDNPECKNNETSVAWNIQGIPGADGADGTDGTDGDDGADGEQGLPGISGWEVVTNVETTAIASVSHSSPLSSVADCPTGKRVLGGGGSDRIVITSDGETGTIDSRIKKSRPYTQPGSSFHNRWGVTIHLNISDAGPGKMHEVTAFAICANVEP